MQLELKPVNKLTYKLRLTPQVRLAINLLQMPLVKLKEFIKQRIEENPLLEYLKQEGMFVARRTIAKYRNQLKALSSKSRRE